MKLRMNRLNKMGQPGDQAFASLHVVDTLYLSSFGCSSYLGGVA
jgi:hypothetical protein